MLNVGDAVRVQEKISPIKTITDTKINLFEAIIVGVNKSRLEIIGKKTSFRNKMLA